MCVSVPPSDGAEVDDLVPLEDFEAFLFPDLDFVMDDVGRVVGRGLGPGVGQRSPEPMQTVSFIHSANLLMRTKTFG